MTPPAAPRRRLDPDPAAVAFGGRFVAAVSAGSVLNPVNSSIIAIALVSIGRAFGVGADTTAWLVSALYLAAAVGQPTMGHLADAFGPRRTYLAGLALVAAGGLLGWWGPSIGVLVAARVVIGLGTSAAYPAAMAAVRRQSERLGRPAPGGVLGALAIAGQVSMGLGPPLGGLLIALGGWRSIFLVNLPLAAVGAVFALVWLPADEARPRRGGGAVWRALDPGGLALFVGALTSLLVFLMGLSEPRWDLLAVAVALLAALVGWELRHERPFIDVRMLATNRALTATYLRFGVTWLVSYSFFYSWTQWVEEATGRSPSATGLLLTPLFVVAVLGSLIGSRGRRVLGPLLIGTTALALGSASLLLLEPDSPTWMLLVTSVLFGVPTGLNVIGNQAALYAQAPPEATGTAAGLLRTFMYLGAVLSAALISIIYQERATTAGLHDLAAVLTATSTLLLVATLFSRSLRTR